MQERMSATTARVFASLRRSRGLILLLLIAAILFVIPSRGLQAAAGELDPTFGKGGQVTEDFFGNGAEAHGLAVQPDGKIVVAAGGSGDGTNGDLCLTRLNPDGSLDASFGTGGKVTTDISGAGSNDWTEALAIQNDGKIVVGGMTFFISLRFALARYNADGSLDASFGTGGKVVTDFSSFDDFLSELVIQPDGKIIAVGFTNTTFSGLGPFNFALVRYNPDGSLDTTFGTGGKVTTDFNGQTDLAFDAALQPDGKIVVAGSIVLNGQFQFIRDFALARYNTDGSLDATFGAGGKVTTEFFGSTDEAFGVVIQQDGKIIAGGRATDEPTGTDFGLVRYNSNGTLDTGFGSNGKVMTDFSSIGDTARAISLLPDGKIVAAGLADDDEGNGITDFALAQYNQDGSLDPTFGAGGKVRTDFLGATDWVNCIDIQPDGKIVAGGRTENVMILARYLNCTTQVSPGSAFFPATGGEQSVTMITPSDCAWAAASNASWIEITSSASGAGDAVISYVVRDNLAAGGRQGTLTLGGKVFTITQTGSSSQNCSFMIAPKFESFSAGGGAGAINVTTDPACAWQAKSDVKWIVMSSGCCGLGSGAITYLVSPNMTGAPRKGLVTIGGKSFSVKQNG